jgi:hypothetical protein
MSNNFQKFLKDLKKESQDSLDSLNKRIKDVGNTIQESLMKPKSEQGTPVITSHLRDNWIVTIDQEFFNVVGSREKPDDSLQSSNWSKFLNTDDVCLHSNIYWNNNVYYGPWVNYGADGIPAQKFREKAKQDGEERLKVIRK